jgi:ABC-type antimicrobial peptide transport system permease subunit
MKSTIRTLRSALNALRRNVTRSILTCLGIIIGVGAVIAMMEIGNGSSEEIQNTIAKMGANVLMIFPGQASTGGVSFGNGSRVTLTPADCDAILTECPAAKDAAPCVYTRMQIIYAGRNWQPDNMFGTTPNYLNVRDWPLSEGELFSDHDVQSASLVCLVGQTIVRELFDGESPIGKEIRVRNVNMRVVGVLAAKGASMSGSDQDDVFVAPWTTVKYRLSGSGLGVVNQSAAVTSTTSVNTLNNLYPSSSLSLFPAVDTEQAADRPQPIHFPNIDRIYISVYSAADMDSAMKQITSLLRARHRLKAAQDDDFVIRDTTEFNRALSSTSTMMSTLLLCVAAISLMVGGVGIMNIMLVSVTERTREIGLRMAVGARGQDILKQFLIEAVLLCLLGGAIGIICGRGSSMLVTMILHWPTRASLPAIIAAVFVSATVGIVFGYYPAWKASRLDPITALRFE